MKTVIKKQNGKIEFYRNGNKVYDFVITGNIVSFSTGEFFLL